MGNGKTKKMRRAPRDRAVPLEPVDPARCQCRKSVGAFALGGLIGSERRCDARPAWISVEKVPGEDGQHGAMSLCGDCKEVLEEYIRDGKAPAVIFVALVLVEP